MWIIITLIVIVAAATAVSIGAWMSVLLDAETPICPRCGAPTRKISVRAAHAPERMVLYRCRECGNDPTPPERLMRWAKSRLEPPQ